MKGVSCALDSRRDLVGLISPFSCVIHADFSRFISISRCLEAGFFFLFFVA